MAIDRNQLVELRLEAQKLKDYRNMNKVNQERLAKLLSLLEQSIREVMNEDGTLNLPVSDVSFNLN
jgi:DNA-binding XRE family transcriptional regulator